MFRWLFERDFLPHGHCYFWRPDILWTNVISDGVIAVAYYSIPVTLVYFASKKKDIPFREILGLFAAFIILCGTTHILGIVTVWKPIYAVDGVIKAITATVSIVTALVLIPLVPVALSMRMPAELEAANRLLQEEVKLRTHAEKRLETAVESLHRSNEELEEFAFIASHDLQSPLRGIVSFTQLLGQECQGKISKDADKYFGLIDRSGQRMQALINDLLDFSRIGKDREPPKMVSAGEALQQALEQLHAEMKEKDVKVEVAALPEVMGNQAQISRLFQNLIGNAIKYVAPGVKPEVRISVSREERHWHFIVADNGIGIPYDKFKEIFVIFRRLHTADEFSGTGIGLSVCKKIVERHGGRIWVESTPGKGSRFHFTLLDADVKAAMTAPVPLDPEAPQAA